MGIGAAKSGTTWLSDCLREHPQVCMSEPKEVNYFNESISPADTLLYKYKRNPHFRKSLQWYFRHFSHSKPDQLKAEFSVIYLSDKTAPVKIKETFPDVKLLVCLRNPIDRAYSHYWMYHSYFKVEKRSFEEAINHDTMYLDAGFYSQQLKHYLSFFDKSQIHLILFDDIKANPESEFKKVCEFLNIDSTFVPSALRKKSNESKISRFKKFPIITESISRTLSLLKLGFLLQGIRKLGIKKFIMALGTKKTSYPPMNPETRPYLFNLYQRDIEDLQSMLNRDLSKWK